MPNLYNAENGALISLISNDQLQFLIDNLEEESSTDRDYAIEDMTLAYFQTVGIDPALLELLKKALGDRQQIIIRWE